MCIDEEVKKGSSMKFLGRRYKIGERVWLQEGDNVLVHPVFGVSQATMPYQGIVVSEVVKGRDGRARGTIRVLAVEINLSGCRVRSWINDYLFSRLEFERRG